MRAIVLRSHGGPEVLGLESLPDLEPQRGEVRIAVAATGGLGVDVTLDFVGAPYLEPNLRAAALDGRLVLISTLGGAQASISLRDVLARRLRLAGTTLRNRPLEQKMTLTQRFAREILPHFRRDGVWPVIDREFPLEEIAAAHRWMEEDRNVGKIVVRVGRPLG